MSRKRKITLICLVLLLSLLVAGCGLFGSGSHQEKYSTTSVLSAVDAYITDEMKSQNIPGLSVGIVKDNRIVFLKGYGQADSSGRAVTPDTPFILGSNSKSITAMAVLQLVEAGKIDLDAPVQEYIPSFQVMGPKSSTSRKSASEDLSKDVSSSITVRHLLNQTSGIPPSVPNKTVDPTYNGKDALDKRAQVYTEGRVQLNRPVGKSYEYANDNYLLLGLIVQRVSGQSYEDYIKEHIFEPLKMHSSFTLQKEAREHGLANAHRRLFGLNVEFTSPQTFSRGDIPAGYLISSAKDLSHYIIAQLSEGHYEDVSILSPASIDLMQSEPVPNTYAMGWLSSNVNGISVIGHAGGTIGYQSHIWFAPEEGIGVVVLANVLNAIDASIPNMEISTTTHLASGIISLMANLPLPDQGLNMTQKYWIVNSLVVLLSVYFIFTMVRVSKRFLRFSEINITNRTNIVRRAVVMITLHFIWPSAVFLMTVTEAVPVWHILSLYQPDLILWIKIMAIAVFLKGTIEIGILLKINARRIWAKL